MSRRDFILFGAWCLVPLWLLFPAWAAPDMALFNYGDLYSYHHPMRHLVAGTLQSGRLPFWNPYIFLGLPLSANPQSVLFYPGTLLAYQLPLGLAFSLEYLFHFVWGGLGVFLLARNNGLGRGPALAVTTLYSLCPFLVYRITEGIPTLFASLVWAPWAWLALQSGSWLFLGGVLGLQFLSGHPQFMAINCLGMGLWALACRSGRLLGRLALAGAAAALLASLQWIPTREFLANSVRKNLPASFTTAYSIGAGTLATWLYPGMLGTPRRGGSGNWPDVPSVFFETCGVYVGLAGLAAALFWLFRRRPLLPILLIAAGLFLAAGGNNPLYRLAVAWSPLGYLRTPSRALLLCVLGLVFAAGGAARARFSRLPAWARLAALALVLADLALWDRRFLAAEDSRPFMAPSRSFAETAGGRAFRVLTDPGLASPNKAMVYRAMNANGYEAFYLGDFPVYAARSEGGPACDGSRSYLSRFDSPEMNRAGVALRVGPGGDIVANPKAYPLAYFAGGNDGLGPARGEAGLAVPRPERWSVSGAAPEGGGTLVLAQAHYPGWRAFLNGRQAPLSKWDGIFQAVAVPEGEFHLEAVFRPTAWPFLALLAAFAWAAWLCAAAARPELLLAGSPLEGASS